MTQEKIKEAASLALTRYLTDHGMRKTPERYTILNHIFSLQGHFTIQALHSHIEDTGYHLSRTTLFNTVALLVAAGLVRRHTFATETPRYERIIGLPHHHHLICTNCGKIREVKDSALDEILSQRRYGKFSPSQIDINIYGLCATCQRRSKSSLRASK